MMFARRRADASKQIAVNKAKAHAGNHKKAQAAFLAEEEAKKAKIVSEEAAVNANKLGTK